MASLDIIKKNFVESKDKKKFIREIEKKDDHSSGDCEFLALIYLAGVKDLIEVNEKRGRRYLAEGVESGSSSCMVALGDLYANDEKSEAKAEVLFRSALEAKDYRAANSLGIVAMKKNKLDEAIKFFKIGSENNIPAARNNFLIATLEKANLALGLAHEAVRTSLNMFVKSPEKKVPEKNEKEEEKKEPLEDVE